MKVFIATLGSKPQVVTAALDLLLKQGEKISKAVLVHTVSQKVEIALSLEILEDELSRDIYGFDGDVDFVPVVDQDGQALKDVVSAQDEKSFFSRIYHVVHNLKQKGYQIHFSIAGGRKTMAIFGMVTAQLLFDEQDKLWHLFSPSNFMEENRYHPREGDQVKLIPIPVVQWSDISPILLDLKASADPFDALETQQKLKLTEKLDRSDRFIKEVLTPEEERVVCQLVVLGIPNEQIADKLLLSTKAVEDHLETASQKAANYWQLEQIDRIGLVTLLNLYYSTKLEGPLV